MHISISQFKQLNKRGKKYCLSLARGLSTKDQPKTDKDWCEYWSDDEMISFLELKGFTVLGSKESLTGIMWGKPNESGWFPPAISEDATNYLWRFTKTVLNTLDAFGNISDETLRALGYSSPLTKPKFS